MTMDLETEVREALAARAGALPNAAAARLRGVGYRPRRSRRVPVTTGALAGAATAGTVIAVVVVGGAPAAYAGWSPTPTSASTTPSPGAASNCQDQLSSAPAGPARGELGSGAWQNVLTDVRGPFTVALFQNDGAYAACFTSSSFTAVNQIATSGNGHVSSGSISVHGSSAAGQAGQPSRSSVDIRGTNSGDLQDVTQTHLSTTADGPYTLVDGRTASGVTGVTLVQAGGQDVVATVADGWFVAWWPGTADADTAQVTTASGTQSEQLQILSISPPPPSAPSGVPVSGSSGNSGNTGNTGSAGTTENSGGGSGGSGGGPSTNSSSRSGAGQSSGNSGSTAG
jgi:hypothetical protein